MKKRILFPILLLLSMLGGLLHPNSLKPAQAAAWTAEKTLVLYDASSGSIPSETLMDFTDFPPGAASLAYSDGTTVLDSGSSGRDTYAGWVSSQATTADFPVLDRASGFQLNFTLKLENESHTKNNRSGFSVILLDQEAKGIEISFWENEIWVQSDDRTGGLFTHGESVPFGTDTGVTAYQLTIAGDTYTLTGNSQPLLTGPVRDYGAFEGFPDPYETPNFLFLGDDTTSARSRVLLSYVSIRGTEPVLPTVAVTSTSTAIPLPTASVTPPPSATPVPTLTVAPTGKANPLCPSGWLLVLSVMSCFILARKSTR